MPAYPTCGEATYDFLQKPGGNAAVAIAVFVAAHGVILSTFLKVGWRSPQYALAGEPVVAPSMLVFGIQLGYVGFLFLADPEPSPSIKLKDGIGTSDVGIVIVVTLTILAPLPLLLHAGVAAYARSR